MHGHEPAEAQPPEPITAQPSQEVPQTKHARLVQRAYAQIERTSRIIDTLSDEAPSQAMTIALRKQVEDLEGALVHLETVFCELTGTPVRGAITIKN